jgi:hypothetical protein
MSGLLSFFGGVGAGAATLANKYIDEDIENNRLALQQKYALDNKAKSLEIEDQYAQKTDQRNEAKLTDANRARLIAEAQIAGEAPKAEFNRKQTIDDANNPDLMAANRAITDSKQATSDVNLKNKQADYYDAGSEQRRAGVIYDENGNAVGKLNAKDSNQYKTLLEFKKANDESLKTVEDLIKNGSFQNKEQEDALYKRRDKLLSIDDAFSNSLLGYGKQSNQEASTSSPSNKSIPANSSAYDDEISKALKANGLDDSYKNYIKGIIAQESSFNPKAIGDGGKAVGLVQSHEGFAKDYGIADRNDPVQSINGAVKAFAENVNRFGSVEKAIAAHNAGAEGVANGVNNQSYVNDVLGYAKKFDGTKQDTNPDNSKELPQEKTVAAKKQEPFYLNKDQRKEFKETQSDLVDHLFTEAKDSGEPYDNKNERLALFRNYVDTTGDIQGAKTLALASTFTNGVPTYNGQVITSSALQDEIRKLGKGTSTEPKQESQANVASSDNEPGFDSKDIARINKFPDIVQQAIIKSDDPKKVLDTFEKNKFSIDSIKQEILNSLTDSQRRVFENMTPEQQKEFISNPESTVNDYPDAVSKSKRLGSYKSGLLGFN